VGERIEMIPRFSESESFHVITPRVAARVLCFPANSSSSFPNFVECVR
jgi:hypothetical protein